MKIQTKANIIFWTTIILTIGATVYFMDESIINRNNKLNICAEEYGYELRSYWDGGSMQLNYTDKYFNETHIACCHKVRYLDDGEIKDLNCTGVFALK